MVCEHLQKLEEELLNKGFKADFRGRAWSRNCREWVYFRCIFDLEAVFRRLDFDPDFVRIHRHRGTHDGSEAGFECTLHHDAIMGIHPFILEEPEPPSLLPPVYR